MGDYLTEGMGMMSLRRGIENENGTVHLLATHSLTPSGHQLTPSAINATSQSARFTVSLTDCLNFQPISFSCHSSQFYLLSIDTSVCAVLDQPPLLPLSHFHSL